MKRPRRYDVVQDRWWPWRIGRVIKVMKTRIKVRWAHGEIETYDNAHLQFLERLPNRS